MKLFRWFAIPAVLATSIALHGADLAAGAAKLGPLTAHTTVANYQMRPRYRYVPTLVNYEKLTPTIQAVPIDEGFSHSHTLPDFPSPSITKVTLEISFSRTFCRNSITNREHAY